ncbi:MAG: trehalase family glycosidase [Armatimonadota bacterium]|jgi:hypothetical protein
MRNWRLTAALLAAVLSRPGDLLAQAPWKTAPSVSKPIIGALDPADRSALVFLAQGEAVFGVRPAIEYAGVRLAGPELRKALIALGPFAPDSSYGASTWRFPGASAITGLGAVPLSPPPDVRLRWGKQGDSGAVAILDVSAPCDVVLEPYYPFGIAAHYSPSPTLRGLVAWSGTVAGASSVGYFRLEANRHSRTPSMEEVDAGKGMHLRFRLGGGERLAIRAQVGAKPIGALQVAPDAIETALERTLATLQARPAPGPMGGELFRLLTYRPGSGSTYLASEPAGGNVSGPDAWLSALAAAAHSKPRAYDIIYTLCETQLVTGCVPGFVDPDGETSEWSQPPLGSYCVLTLHERFRDRALLEYAYPRLLRWYGWWVEDSGTGAPRRDGNGDGLLEWGGDSLEDAKRESGMPESPLWDEVGFDETTRTMTLNAIDLNSFRALDASCLARMAEILKRPGEAEALRADYQAMRDRVNAALWEDEKGVYFGRHWDGRLEARPTLASLYPLIAGIPTRTRTEKMVRHALGHPQSWAGPMLPTLSAEDAAYDASAPWRGAVSPLGNYIVYEGLKRHGYDREAAHLARRSAALVAGASGPGEGWHNCYDAATGAGIGAPWQRSGALLSLIGGQ